MLRDPAPAGRSAADAHAAARAVRLLARLTEVPLPGAAERLTAAGFAVFPCRSGEKRPLTAHGLLDATTDVEQVRAWWRRWPGANIGLPTGSISGLAILDIDRRAAGSGYATFARLLQAGLADGWAGLVRTPSGGLHAYYPADPAGPARCWQAAGHHVDFRGDGGYVIAPPSRVTSASGSDVGYSVARVGGAQPRLLPVDTIRDLLLPRAHPEPASSRPAGQGHAEADRSRLAAWVAARSEGERNRGLFWAACRLVEAGAEIEEIRTLLAPAAERAGLPAPEIASTISSACRTAGSDGPRIDTDRSRRAPAPVVPTSDVVRR